MATLYKPAFEIKINGFDVSNAISPYLISINIEEVFNTSFAPTKLELVFHASYVRYSPWKYKDLVKVKLWWEPFPQFFYESPTFYVDYIDDTKSGGGNQTFRVSALAADPELGFSYGVGQISYINTTIRTAITNFANNFGLNVFENLASNVFLGTINDINNVNDPPDVNSCKIEFQSYADMLKYICNTYGYYGDLRGTNLRLIDISTNATNTSRFFVWDFNDIFDFNAKQSFNPLYKQYNVYYVDRDNNNAYAIGFGRPGPYLELNNKEENIDFNSAYYNVQSATRRVTAKMLQDYLEGFEVTITLSGLPEFTAGNTFLLNPDYGNHAGFYRCTRCRHIIDGERGWVSELTGYPIDVPFSSFATFTVGYLGNRTIPDPTDILTITTGIVGTLSALNGTQLDDYARQLNPGYNQNLGTIFITEGNKTGNQIRADIAFCIALYETKNFTRKELLDNFNPLYIVGNGSGVAPHNFTTWADGVRGGIQHLFAYAVPSGLPADTVIDPRFNFVTRGIAPNLDDFAGTWTSDLDFVDFVKRHLKQLYSKYNPEKTIIVS